jgi:hypothetical protein
LKEGPQDTSQYHSKKGVVYPSKSKGKSSKSNRKVGKKASSRDSDKDKYPIQIFDSKTHQNIKYAPIE